jgi:hypothetical protein
MSVNAPQTVRGKPQTLLMLGRVGTSSTLLSLTRNVLRLFPEGSQTVVRGLLSSAIRPHLLTQKHAAVRRRHYSRSAEIKQACLCFNGLYTPFASPVIGGQKRLLVMFKIEDFRRVLGRFW